MELKGYSGCLLNIVDIDDDKYVRKTSSSVAYNRRLIEQMEKQRRCNIEGFQNCKVHDSGYDGDLFYFTMEYLNGRTLAEYMEYVELDRLSEIVDEVTKHYIIGDITNHKAGQLFRKKISSIREALDKDGRDLITNSAINEALIILDEFSWEKVVASECHGDMTLENIIVSKRGLYLIDFLDSFYDSWMIDAAKLLQDALCYWSYRTQKMSVNLKVRLLVFKDLLIDRIRKMDQGDILMDTVYHVLLLNVLRIIPYLKNDSDYIYLEETTKSIIGCLEGKRE